MDSSLIDSIVALMEKGKQHPVSAWGAIYGMLEDANFAYSQKISVEKLLVHPENRAQLGVNAHTARCTGGSVLRVGANFNELHKSTCFELSSNATARDQQLQFNQRLVDGSDGMLANVSGSERFLTVASSHTAAFCRACKAGCSTSIQSLAQDGKLCLAKVCHDSVFKSMVEEGWMWKVVSAQAADAIPGLAALAEKALNASNNVVNQCSEVEIGLRIAGHP